jgi:hypothetical protein
MFSIQASEILIQPAKISRKTYQIYKVIQKQICDATHHMVVLVMLPIVLLHAGGNTVEAS